MVERKRKFKENRKKSRKNACAGPILKRNTIFYRYFLTTDGVINRMSGDGLGRRGWQGLRSYGTDRARGGGLEEGPRGTRKRRRWEKPGQRKQRWSGNSDKL